MDNTTILYWWGIRRSSVVARLVDEQQVGGSTPGLITNIYHQKCRFIVFGGSFSPYSALTVQKKWP